MLPRCMNFWLLRGRNGVERGSQVVVKGSYRGCKGVVKGSYLEISCSLVILVLRARVLDVCMSLFRPNLLRELFHLQSKVDEFIPQAQHVNLGIVRHPEPDSAGGPSKVNEFVLQTQHVNLGIGSQAREGGEGPNADLGDRKAGRVEGLLLLQQIRFGHLHRLSDLKSHGQGKSQHYYSKSTLLPKVRIIARSLEVCAFLPPLDPGDV